MGPAGGVELPCGVCFAQSRRGRRREQGGREGVAPGVGTGAGGGRLFLARFPWKKAKAKQDGSRADRRAPQAPRAEDECSKRDAVCWRKHTLLNPPSFSQRSLWLVSPHTKQQDCISLKIFYVKLFSFLPICHSLPLPQWSEMLWFGQTRPLKPTVQAPWTDAGPGGPPGSSRCPDTRPGSRPGHGHTGSRRRPMFRKGHGGQPPSPGTQCRPKDPASLRGSSGEICPAPPPRALRDLREPRGHQERQCLSSAVKGPAPHSCALT